MSRRGAESICALNLGLDVEEEWDPDQGGGRTTAGNDGDGDGDDGDGDRRASLERRAARLVSVGSPESRPSTRARRWRRRLHALRESGRSGRAAHPPGSAAGAAALPHPGLVARETALAADESVAAPAPRLWTRSPTRAITTAALVAGLGCGQSGGGARSPVPARGSSAKAPRRRRRTWRATRRSRWNTRARRRGPRGLDGRGGLRSYKPGSSNRVRASGRIVAAEALLSIGRRREASAAPGALNAPTETRGRGARCVWTAVEGPPSAGGAGRRAALKRAASLRGGAPGPLADFRMGHAEECGDGVGTARGQERAREEREPACDSPRRRRRFSSSLLFFLVTSADQKRRRAQKNSIQMKSFLFFHRRRALRSFHIPRV